MKIAIVVSALGSGITLAGCVQASALMKNPKTGQVMECRPIVGVLGVESASTQVGKCAAALQRDGWVRLTPK